MGKRKSFDYPKPVKQTSGCKVGWMFYSDKATAKKAATVAKREARHKAGLGFDFGYCMPGSIDEQDGMYRVCVP